MRRAMAVFAAVLMASTLILTGGAAAASPATVASGGTVSTILYSDNYDGIWTVKADGSGLREVNTVATGDVTYAPDGIHYAYLTDGSISQLWTASTAGGPSHHLTAAGNNVMAAVWSPNGKWIAYLRAVGNGFDIFLIPSGGGTPRRLTFEAAHNCGAFQPAWSPDSTTIVYTRFADFAGSSCGPGGLVVQKIGHPGTLVVPEGAFTASFTPTGNLVYMTLCPDSIQQCQGNNMAAWEANADGSDPTYIEPTDEACGDTFNCLVGIEGAARNRGWVAEYEYQAPDENVFGSCFVGGYQKAGVVTNTAPNFCLPSTAIVSYDVH